MQKTNTSEQNILINTHNMQNMKYNMPVEKYVKQYVKYATSLMQNM
jgi:hypothetical protein